MTIIANLAIVAMFLTVASLFIGIGSMAEGGEFDDRHSHELMFGRVALQALTVALVIVALLQQAG
ncbi:MAG TPA: twin transmembrane helix small protein [Burkholderiales bacterium]